LFKPIIEAKEIRYWIRRLPTLRHANNNLLGELEVEIPVYLLFTQPPFLISVYYQEKKSFRDYESNGIKKVLQDSWKLIPSENSNASYSINFYKKGSKTIIFLMILMTRV